jgi:CheY-like chemotaxis protein
LLAILALLGWETILARGRKRLTGLYTILPKVILLDIRIPEMDAYELAAILKAHPEYQNIPVLAASAISGHTAKK